MSLLYHRGPNVAMKRHLMRSESLIRIGLGPETFYLSGIAVHAHPNAAEIAPHPRSRLACVANVTSSITTPIVNHAGQRILSEDGLSAWK